MSVQDFQSNPETAAEPEDLVIRRLVRALDYAEGFWLGFAKSNAPAQRRRLAAACRDLLEPLKIRVLEIELKEPVTDLLPLLRERLAHERAARDGGAQPREESAQGRPKLAIFVCGLEHSISSREAYPLLLSSLNLNRELFRQHVPHPLLLWLPDYALTALARKAPDFWAWRSGLYEFAPERETAEQSLGSIRHQALHEIGSLPEQAKRERLVMLKGLLDDYLQLGDGSHEQGVRANILNQIGLTYRMLGEWDEAKKVYGQSLAIARSLGNRFDEALGLYNLASLAHDQGEIEDARRLYGEALEIRKEIGYELGVAYTLHDLGRLARDTGELEEAGRLYNESLQIKRRVPSKQLDVALSLYELGALAQERGDVDAARRLYNESLEIERQFGDRDDIAYTLHRLGQLAESEGMLEEARRLYNEALEIRQQIGERRGIAISYHELGRLAGEAGDFAEARRLYGKSLLIKKEIGDQRGVAYTLHAFGRIAHDMGELEEARRFYDESLRIKKAIGDRRGVAATLHRLGLLAHKQGEQEEARQLLREALGVFEKLDSPKAQIVRQSLARVEGGEDVSD